MPGEKVLRAGDIVNIDVTVIKDGWHGDTSRMFYVGEPSVQARRLCEVTYECMWKGIDALRPGATLGDIGAAIQKHAEASGYSVVREFCGHGIGRRFHEEPQILHYGRAGQGPVVKPGMTFTVEPMINAGRRDIRQLADGWTIVTADHSLSAQWEHTVLVTDDAYEVLTRSAGAPAPPAFVEQRKTVTTAGFAGRVMPDMSQPRHPAPPQQQPASARRAWIKLRRDELQRRYFRRPDPQRTLVAHSQFVDELLQSLWRATIDDPQSRWSRSAAMAAARSFRTPTSMSSFCCRTASRAARRSSASSACSGTAAWTPATACAPSPSASRKRPRT